jgi:hypothetical protein
MLFWSFVFKFLFVQAPLSLSFLPHGLDLGLSDNLAPFKTQVNKKVFIFIFLDDGLRDWESLFRVSLDSFNSLSKLLVENVVWLR